MVTTLCYKCGVEIGAENFSEEHLISNVIGGYRKSKNLLCRPCNIELSPLDNALGLQFNMFMVLLKAERDRGEPRPILATEIDTGIETILTPDGKSVLRHPIEIKGEGFVEIHAGTNKRLRQELARKKKLNPELDVEKAIAESTFTESEIFKVFHSFSVAEADLVLRGVAKIAVNHYIVSTGVISDVAPAIRFVVGGGGPRIVQILNQGVADEIVYPFHFINLVGNKVDRLLYGYIELFNVARFLILLNDQYEGPEYVFSQIFGLDGSQTQAAVTIQSTREKLLELINADIPGR